MLHFRQTCTLPETNRRQTCRVYCANTEAPYSYIKREQGKSYCVRLKRKEGRRRLKKNNNPELRYFTRRAPQGTGTLLSQARLKRGT